MHPLIFIDIDGVLTRKDDSSSYLCENPDTYRLSEEIIERLSQVLYYTNAKIVIASNWRNHEDKSTWTYHGIEFKNPLPDFRKAFGSTIIDTLPKIRGISKSEALLQYFDAHPVRRRKSPYVILDDQEKEGYQNVPELVEHFILTDPEHGLTQDLANDVMTVLGYNRMISL